MFTISEEKVQEMFERYVMGKRHEQNAIGYDHMWFSGRCSEAEKWLKEFGVDLSYERIQPMVDGQREVKAFD